MEVVRSIFGQAEREDHSLEEYCGHLGYPAHSDAVGVVDGEKE
jgi:hypothetical protein